MYNNDNLLQNTCTMYNLYHIVMYSVQINDEWFCFYQNCIEQCTLQCSCHWFDVNVQCTST